MLSNEGDKFAWPFPSWFEALTLIGKWSFDWHQLQLDVFLPPPGENI